MKNRIVILGLILPMLVIGCDSLFDKGDVEKTYEGPDQVELFRLLSNNDLGCSVQSTSITVQLISENGVASSDVAVNFSAAGGSTARATTDYSFGTTSPVTIAAGETSTSIPINFVVTTMDDVATTPEDIDSTRAFGTYDSLAATGGAGTGALFTVKVAPYGEIAAVSNYQAPDSARVSGTYRAIAASGGSGTGAIFDVIVPEYGEIASVDTTAGNGTDPARTAGTYRNRIGIGGSGTEATFDIVIDAAGVTTSVTINNTGFRYDTLDTITIPFTSIGGTGSNLVLDVSEVSAIAKPTVEIVDEGSRYIVETETVAGDTLTIAAADLGLLGGDLKLAVSEVSQIAAPTVTVVQGGVGYSCTDVFTIADASLGAAGASALEFDAAELTGSFGEQLGLDEVLLILQIDDSNVKVAANQDTSRVFMEL